MKTTATTCTKKKTFLELSPEEWLRGANLPNVEHRCMELCKKYIGGSWAAAQNPQKDITVRRLAGGLTNQLYHVQLINQIKQAPDKIHQNVEPREVAIKFYQPKLTRTVPGKDERLSDTIISVLTSQLSLGPKVYGIDDEGVIQGFYRHEPFKAKHQNNENLLRELMHKLAAINLLQVPIAKTRRMFAQNMKQWVKCAFADVNLEEKVHQFELEMLIKHDLRVEFDEFEKIIENASNPLVFCHNDFRSSNIMVTEGGKLVLCDFEYCCYGLRGHDLANFLLEWGQGGTSNEQWGQWKIPPSNVITHCARLYLQGCDLVQQGYSKQSGNSLSDIVRDVKVCLLETLMFFVTFMANQRESICEAMEFDPKEHLKMVESIYTLYWQVKQQLKAEQII